MAAHDTTTTPGTTGTTGTVVALGLAQTLAWASSFYLPAVLATPMARELGVATPTVFAAFSGALVIGAVVGPAAGRRIDRHGGRGLLMATNGLFALGLVALSQAQGLAGLVAAWAVLGVAMGAGLYDTAFATLVRLYGTASRNPITGITLIAGFASTVGWPASAAMAEAWGWRGACLGWAALHVLLGLPLNALLPRAAPASVPAAATPVRADDPAGEPAEAAAPTAPPPWRNLLLLAFAFTATRFVGTAIGTHLPGLLMALGATLAAAVAAGALVGPAQVAGRLLEFGVLRRVHPLLSARLAALAHPIGALALLVVGLPAAALFALLHGAGNGILTIAKGTLPLVLFGAHGYGARQGWLSAPGLVLQALAPWLFGLALAQSASTALMLSGGLTLAALAALLALRVTPARPER
jgi:MFS family permease